jgi:hypothetical protein
VCGKIGDKFCERFLDPLAQRIDALQAVAARRLSSGRLELLNKTRRGLRDRTAKLRNKIKHKVDDLHWKTCRFLCMAFQRIFIPHFGTKEMVRHPEEGVRVINCKTTRRMLELSHGRFLERLRYYAMTKRIEVFVVPEAYTTMTCGKAPGAPRQRSCLSAACRTARWAAPRSFPALTQTAATGWRGICTGAATSASPPSPGCAKRQLVLPEKAVERVTVQTLENVRSSRLRPKGAAAAELPTPPEMGSGRSSHARCERSLISCI